MERYHYETKDKYQVLRVYNDINDFDYRTAIVKTPRGFIICRGYDETTGTWNQGYYGYSCEDAAIFALHKLFMDIVEWRPLFTLLQGFYCF